MTVPSSDRAVAYRFRVAADILEGMTDGIDGDRDAAARDDIARHADHVAALDLAGPAFTTAEVDQIVKAAARRVDELLEANNRYLDRARLAEAGRAIGDIAAERRRQVEVEGWTTEYDDTHRTGEMACAAAAYAAYSSSQNDGSMSAGALALKLWPWAWAWAWWKPDGDKRRNLVKAGALIVADIDRLDRQAGDPR